MVTTRKINEKCFQIFDIDDTFDVKNIFGKRWYFSESANSLQEQINALTEENAGLKSKLSIGGSDPSALTGDRSFNELAPEEQFAELQRRAAEVDAGGGY